MRKLPTEKNPFFLNPVFVPLFNEIIAKLRSQRRGHSALWIHHRPRIRWFYYRVNAVLPVPVNCFTRVNQDNSVKESMKRFRRRRVYTRPPLYDERSLCWQRTEKKRTWIERSWEKEGFLCHLEDNYWPEEKLSSLSLSLSSLSLWPEAFN